MKISTEGNTFDKYACIGDTIEREVGKFRLVARLEFDDDGDPTDGDRYDDYELRAWAHGKWQFVGIVIGVSYDGITLDDHMHSVWGHELNFPGGNHHLTAAALEYMEEALEEAEELRKDMAERLAA